MIAKVKHLKLIQFSVGLNLLRSGDSCWHRARMFAQGDGKFSQEMDPPNLKKGGKILIYYFL